MTADIDSANSRARVWRRRGWMAAHSVLAVGAVVLVLYGLLGVLYIIAANYASGML